MKKVRYGIPTYQEIKGLSLDNEYIYKVINCIGSGYFRITYNEDFNKQISLDYIEHGYLHSCFINSEFIINKLYPFNKNNFTKMINTIPIIKQAIIDKLEEYK